MKTTKLYAPTLREVPAEAELISHQLMLRAGMIRMLAAGIYTYLPLGLKVIKKIEQIVREEMNHIDSQETLMPVLTPAELWKESSRWDVFGPEMFRLKDRHDRQFCLGPTHEEVFTHLVRHEVKSYKQLPLSLYQIQTKFRDEKRPRFGLMRGREFIMKDAYTFDRDEAAMKAAYSMMWQAYKRIFIRCELAFKIVEGDSGAMGGSDSHEFIAMSPIGETEILYCSHCGYAATAEKAEKGRAAELAEKAPELEPVERAIQGSQALDAKLTTMVPIEQAQKVFTPDIATIDALTQYLGVEAHRFAKTLLFTAADIKIAVMIPGHRNLNHVKLANYLGLPEHALEMATGEVVEETTHAAVGFAGPIVLTEGAHVTLGELNSQSVRLIVDSDITRMGPMIVGANETNYHLKDILYGVHFVAEVAADLLMVTDKDPCPRCSSPLNKARGNEVGNIFQLGTKYSEALGANYLDEEGKSRPLVMGSHGIGITRTMAAIIEQHHDSSGIRWPIALAPYQVVVIPINRKDHGQWDLALEIYESLRQKGVEVLIDDRHERAGVKFSDADLMGIPLQIIVGKGALEGTVDLKLRLSGNDFQDEPAQTAQTAKTVQTSQLEQTALNPANEPIRLDWRKVVERCLDLCKDAGVLS